MEVSFVNTVQGFFSVPIVRKSLSNLSLSFQEAIFETDSILSYSILEERKALLMCKLITNKTLMRS